MIETLDLMLIWQYQDSMRNLIFLVIIYFSCGPDVPNFDEDRAFDHLLTQCEFGPRNPGSEGYYSCKAFIAEKLETYSDTVIYQDFTFQEQMFLTKMV